MSEGCLVTLVSLVVKSRLTNPPKNTDPRPISKQPHASAWQGLNEVKDAASSCNAAVQPKHLDGNLSEEKGSQTFKQASPSASACKTCDVKCQVMYHILKYTDSGFCPNIHAPVGALQPHQSRLVKVRLLGWHLPLNASFVSSISTRRPTYNDFRVLKETCYEDVNHVI